jgi:hypothetical protein
MATALFAAAAGQPVLPILSFCRHFFHYWLRRRHAERFHAATFSAMAAATDVIAPAIRQPADFRFRQRQAFDDAMPA